MIAVGFNYAAYGAAVPEQLSPILPATIMNFDNP